MIKKGFTLAEIMIVLAVIGVLTAILLPVAINSTPNENIMKFKKGHNALLSAIRELVNSDKYYLDGDLSIKVDGSFVDDSSETNIKYFCQTVADVITTKKINCSTKELYNDSHVTHEAYEDKSQPDVMCKDAAESVGEEIVTPDNIVYYQGSPKTPFGIQHYYLSGVKYENGESSCGEKCLYKIRAYATSCTEYYTTPLTVYKVFCMDIDGIGKGEDSFGYGIRVDGKVLLGARAQEWLQKSIQEKE